MLYVEYISIKLEINNLYIVATLEIRFSPGFGVFHCALLLFLLLLLLLFAYWLCRMWSLYLLLCTITEVPSQLALQWSNNQREISLNILKQWTTMFQPLISDPAFTSCLHRATASAKDESLRPLWSFLGMPTSLYLCVPFCFLLEYVAAFQRPMSISHFQIF